MTVCRTVVGDGTSRLSVTYSVLLVQSIECSCSVTGVTENRVEVTGTYRGGGHVSAAGGGGVGGGLSVTGGSVLAGGSVLGDGSVLGGFVLGGSMVVGSVVASSALGGSVVGSSVVPSGFGGWLVPLVSLDTFSFIFILFFSSFTRFKKFCKRLIPLLTVLFV